MTTTTTIRGGTKTPAVEAPAVKARTVKAGNVGRNATTRARKSAPPPKPAAPEPVEPETQQWLAGARLEVLQCRALRHAWPRQRAQLGKKRRGTGTVLPMNADGIVWEVLEKSPVVVLERTMTCTGGCLVRRVETFTVRPGGRLVRAGRPRMRYPADYKRPRPDDQAPRAQPLDVDVLQGSILARLVPDLAGWA